MQGEHSRTDLFASDRKGYKNKDVSVLMDSKFGARSSAVMAVEQAVAAGVGPQGPTAHGKRPRGRVIEQQFKGNEPTDYVIHLDGPFQEKEVAQDLACAPITRVASEYRESHLRQVAVSDEYITYGLKQGHIRVLHRFSEARALLKGHNGLVADMCFVGNDTLVAGGQNGTLIAWRLKVQDGDNAIHAVQILHITFSPGYDSAPVLLSAAMKTIFATVDNAVVAFDLSKEMQADTAESTNIIDVDPLNPAPGIKVPNFPPQDVAATVDVFPRPDGSIDIAIGSQRGRVYVASKTNDGVITPWETIVHDNGASVSFVSWIDADNEAALIVGSADGRHLTIYESDKHGGHFVKGARVRLEPGSTTNSFINLQVVQEHNIVLLADVPKKALYTLHYSRQALPSGQKTGFDYFARFRVSMSVLNFFAMWNPDAEQAGDDGAIELNCIQTEAVQQYFVDPAMCVSDVSSEATGPIAKAVHATKSLEPEGEEKEEENGQEDEVCPSPPSTPAEPAVTVHVPFPVVLPTETRDTAQQPVLSGGGHKESNGDDSNVPPPRLLTPKDILRSTTPPAAVSSSNVETSQPQKSIPKILRRPSSSPSLPETQQGAERSNFLASTSSHLPPQETLDKSDGAVNETWSRSESGQQAFMASLTLELKRQAALQEASIRALISEALASQAVRIAEERKAIIQEERAGMERLLAAVSNTLNRDLPVRLRGIIKEESQAVSSVLTTALLPAMQETLTTTMAKAASEDKKTQGLSPALQTTVTKTIQDSFRHSFMKQIVPAFESATQNMFMQIDKALQKGLQEHLEASRLSLSDAVKTVIGSQEAMMRSSSIDSAQRSPLAGPTAVKTELTTLLGQGRYEDAFSKALSLQDVAIVSWLCTKVSLGTAILSTSPPALSQMVLLSLVQQLAADLGRGEHTYKLQWIREAALALNPRDTLLAPHIKPVLDQVYDALAASLSSMKEADKQSCKLAMHVVRSQMSAPL